VLLLSGIKLVNVPDANDVIAGALTVLALALAAFLVREYRRRRLRLQQISPQQAA
jgi:hypothetical protein